MNFGEMAPNASPFYKPYCTATDDAFPCGVRCD